MRVWIDITGPAHVLVFRPLVEVLRERGAEVEITTREFSQNVELLRLHGMEATAVGTHGGRSRVVKTATMVTRLAALVRWARPRRFDVALAHASHHLTMAARALRIPSGTTFDYEYATVQHQLGCRAANVVLVPEAIPPERLARYGVRPPKLHRYPGLKEEYYLSDFEPEDAVLDRLELDRERVLVVVRTPSDYALYHRNPSPLFPGLLERLGHDESVQAVVLARTPEQRAEIVARRLPSLVVPEHAVDAQSLIALSDLVVSAGGTMNREAAALGVPVYTTFGGRIGAVDEALLAEGRLRQLTDAAELRLAKRPQDAAGRVRRDPCHFLDLLLPV
jgi:predicted glycosyltransferase